MADGVFCNKGMMMWDENLERRACVPMIRVLVDKLQKVKENESDCRHHVIPLLHTLYYELLQSDHVPASLLAEVCDSFSRYLSDPEPCSSVALRHLRSIRTELSTPGALYQRRLIAEQSLHSPLQERVFVFADPAVVWGPLGASVRANLELGGSPRGAQALQTRLLLHTLQTGLGEACQLRALAATLEGPGRDVLPYFQQMVEAVEQSAERGDEDQYHRSLLLIQHHILNSPQNQPHGDLDNTWGSKSSDRSDAALPHPDLHLPHPDISFHLWNQEEDFWNVLAKLALNIPPSSGEKRDDQERRESVQSSDSGIEKDSASLERRESGKGVKETEERAEERENMAEEKIEGKHQRPVFVRASCISRGLRGRAQMALVRSSVDGEGGVRMSWQDSRHTAKVVVMGDDRVLGRLATAYLKIRRESKHSMLSSKMELQLFYIPVTNELSSSSCSGWTSGLGGRLSLASFLGSEDPCYHSNVYNLGAKLSCTASAWSNHSLSPDPDCFLLDVLSYYLRCAIQPVHLPLYFVKMSLLGGSSVDAVFVSHLQLEFPELRQQRQRLQAIPTRRVSEDISGVAVSVQYKKVFLSKREVKKNLTCTVWTMEISTLAPNVPEGVHTLTAWLLGDSPRHCTEIRSQCFSIRTVDDRTFSICLDRDSRRIFSNVHSLSISPCTDPAYSIQSRPRTRTREANGKDEAGLCKYMSKNLFLPINTFSGVSY
ncbi:phosphoinositide 3-kinase regulatory subunit 6 isoform X2 [Osmerus mordax]|uniref:phosphoinositide 3-kinase regulatory subunit 6 isoform X2 n=1 Tax=Osmerus mordax TaxID=8014 RepID=UPI00350F5A5F